MVKELIQLIIGLAILLWLLNLADAAKIAAEMSTANPVYISAAALSFVVASTMIGLALYASLKKMGVNSPVKDTILASFSGQLLSSSQLVLLTSSSRGLSLISLGWFMRGRGCRRCNNAAS